MQGLGRKDIQKPGRQAKLSHNMLVRPWG